MGLRIRPAGLLAPPDGLFFLPGVAHKNLRVGHFAQGIIMIDERIEERIKKMEPALHAFDKYLSI